MRNYDVITLSATACELCCRKPSVFLLVGPAFSSVHRLQRAAVETHAEDNTGFAVAVSIGTAACSVGIHTDVCAKPPPVVATQLLVGEVLRDFVR